VRVLVTGATGFAGRWLVPELASAGHAVIEAPSHRELDLGRSPDLGPLIRDVRPDVVAHLAAISFLPDAEADPELARRVNVGGTEALFQALDAAMSTAGVLVTSTSDVYAPDAPVPIAEDAQIAPVSAYGQSKVAQEDVASAAASRGRPVTIVRAFNHIGPGQRPVFVVPAFARRVLEVKAGRSDRIAVGSLAARRDFTDVRDVVRAYRWLLERMVASHTMEATVVNVGSGRSVSMEELLRSLCAIAGVEPHWRVDAAKLRPNEIADRVADIGRLRSLTGWEPRIPLETSLRDVLSSASG
jgi:GDP-4-dehydro-6-deoxy-D-mannose reductase